MSYRSFTLTVTFNRLNEHTGTSTFIGTRTQKNNTRLTIATKGSRNEQNGGYSFVLCLRIAEL